MEQRGQWNNLHPALAFLGDNFEAQDTIFSKVHVSLYQWFLSKLIHNASMEHLPNRPALLPPACMDSPLKYEARGPLPSGPLRRALYRYALKAPGSTLM